MITYQGQNFAIRPVQASDVVPLFSWWVDETLCEHDPRPLPRDAHSLVKECEVYCKRFMREVMNENANENIYEYFIITNLGGSPIGFINAFSFDEESLDAEIGVFIGDKSYWKKGIAFHALKEVMRYYFENRGLKRLHIETSTQNEAAKGLFRKLGFVKCGQYKEQENFIFDVMEMKRQ